MTRRHTRYRYPTPDFIDQIDKAGITQAQLARTARTSPQTIYAMLNQKSHPNRRGGVTPETAEALSEAMAELASIDPSTAYRRLFIVQEDEAKQEQSR